MLFFLGHIVEKAILLNFACPSLFVSVCATTRARSRNILKRSIFKSTILRVDWVLLLHTKDERLEQQQKNNKHRKRQRALFIPVYGVTLKLCALNGILLCTSSKLGRITTKCHSYGKMRVETQRKPYGRNITIISTHSCSRKAESTIDCIQPRKKTARNPNKLLARQYDMKQTWKRVALVCNRPVKRSFTRSRAQFARVVRWLEALRRPEPLCMIFARRGDLVNTVYFVRVFTVPLSARVHFRQNMQTRQRQRP